MIRLRGTLEYHDGRVVEFAAGSAARAEWEMYAHRHGIGLEEAPILAALVVACYMLNGTLEGFEAWRSTVLDVELEAAGEPVPPTLREVSGE